MFWGPVERVLSPGIYFDAFQNRHTQGHFHLQIGILTPNLNSGMKMSLSIAILKRIENVFWGSKHLLGVPKTFLHTYKII